MNSRNNLTKLLIVSLLLGSAQFVLFPTPKAQAAVTIGTNTFTQGCVTFGQVVPQGQAVGGLQVGSFATQSDVKNRWPDGSIQFGIVKANITSAGNYPINSASASSGSINPTVPS